MAASQLVGGVDGGIAGLAEEGVIGGAVPARALAEAAVTGACRLAAEGVGGSLFGAHVVGGGGGSVTVRRREE